MFRRKKPVVQISIPKGRTLLEPFSISLMNLLLYSANCNYKIDLVFKDSPIDPSLKGRGLYKKIAEARTALVNCALDHNYDYVLFIDDDMVVPADCIARMLTYDVEFVSGLAFTKNYPYVPTIFYSKYTRDGEQINQKYYHHINYSKGLIEVEAVGLFCALIKTSVFKKIRRPYFEAPELMKDSNIGEDVAFCRRLWEAGIKVNVDTNMVCGHINGDKIITEDDFIRDRENIISTLKGGELYANK